MGTNSTHILGIIPLTPLTSRQWFISWLQPLSSIPTVALLAPAYISCTMLNSPLSWSCHLSKSQCANYMPPTPSLQRFAWLVTHVQQASQPTKCPMLDDLQLFNMLASTNPLVNTKVSHPYASRCNVLRVQQPLLGIPPILSVAPC